MNMADPVLFDTHRFAKRMTAAGMPLEQSETLAEEQAALLVSGRMSQRTTEELKGDVKTFKRDVGVLKEDVAKLHVNVRGLQTGLVVLQTKVTMVQWVTGGIGFGMMLLLVRSFEVI